jgi:hypothetical protein
MNIIYKNFSRKILVEYLEAEGRIEMRWKVWTGFISLRIWTSGGLSSTLKNLRVLESLGDLTSWEGFHSM